MLVLSRKCDEKIFISDDVEVTILGIQGNRVRIGIAAPREVAIRRGEMQVAIETQHVAEVQLLASLPCDIERATA